MKRSGYAVILAASALLVCFYAVHAGSVPPMTENLEWMGRIVVEFRPEVGEIHPDHNSGIAILGDATLDALARQYNVYHMEMTVPGAKKPTHPGMGDLTRFYTLEFPVEIDLQEVAAAYAALPNVKTAEPYYIRKVDYVPNDPLWNAEWHMSNVNAALAYDYCRGDTAVIAGVVDSGIDTAHADLRNNLWINPGEDLNGNEIIEPSERNGIDDEHNGKIDDFYGWNVWQNNNNVQDVAGHGTHCSGCVTGVTDNGLGIASLGWKARVMAAKAGDGQYIYASAAGIDYCSQNGAKVISMSYGGPQPGGVENTAVQNAWLNGVVLIASAGNDDTWSEHYPGAFQNVVAVAATDQNNIKANFSNYGTWVDVCAPGVGIYGPLPGGSYAPWDGTSFSCPLTAGLACLLLAANPGFDNNGLVQHIFMSCTNIDDINPSYAGLLGWGLINAGLAVSSLFPNFEFFEVNFEDPTGNNNGRPDPGETVDVVFTLENTNLLMGATDVEVTLTCADPDINITQNANTFSLIPPGGVVNNSTDPITFTVDGGASPHEATFVLTVTEPTLITPIVYQTVQMIGRPAIIVIDDDGGANFQQFYDRDLDSLGIVHDIWDVNADGEIPQDEILLYPRVIWHTSNSDDPLSQAEQDLISDFLSQGRELFLTGEDIDEQLRDSAFYANVLHCVSEETGGSPQLTGVEGDPISDETTLVLAGPGGAGNNLSPASIAAASGAHLVYTYNSNSLGAGLRYHGAGGELVYFAFNFEAVSNLSTPDQWVLLGNILNWFNAEAVEEIPNQPMPGAYALNQNYPNPFNPATDITFALPNSGMVRMAVYDLTGRLVETLVQEMLPAGWHRATFVARDLASGIYIYRLDAGSASFTRKMILLK